MADFELSMASCLGGVGVSSVGVAISGGGDSTALLLLLVDWSRVRDVKIRAVTVDHGLRAAAKTEALQVARLCANLGVSHDILTWSGWNGRGNLQGNARNARYDLIRDWAGAHKIDVVALGHTKDDQAETVLMRLLRGSGVDGLAGMANRREDGNLSWCRPLLGASRAELRNFLRAKNIDWSEDPSNDDLKFDRVKIRSLLARALEMGLTSQGLADTAARMNSARHALQTQTLEIARNICTVTPVGDIEIQAEQFFALDDEFKLRLMGHSLKWVASEIYQPRRKMLISLVKTISERRKATLSGCFITHRAQNLIRISREPKAVAALTTAPDQIWDGRWAFVGDNTGGQYHIASLGEDGLDEVKSLSKTGPDDLPRDSALALPAIWQGERLRASPLTGWPQGWKCHLQKGAEHYFTSFLSH
ncbi:MAG: tRNA lysidine(34) synthetase TilS [Alphaproteobacteria bacterium]|nr:tRNA lysidine(34) synthetase TilS [Alphaproteobacteria bacterium]